MSELEEQIAVRREKRARLLARGVDAYPAHCAYDLEPADVRAQWDERSADELAAAAVRLRVPGRIRALRDQGRIAFFDLHDGRAKLQVFVRTQALDEPSRELLADLDLGDYLLAEGPLGRTRSGELSLFAERLTLLSKALRPLPEKWHGLADQEARYRRRYLDLIANPESRRTFEIRAALVAGIRRFLEARGFLEVETPMMQAIPGGAVARPFVTHHNALDLELFLRIAPELYLKRLLVGGLHRVYEINRNFRNEGLSTQHNPEFTMLEFYWAYADYRQLMDLTEEMLVGLAREVLKDEKLSFRGKTLDLTPPWPRLTMAEALERLAGLAPDECSTAAGLLSACEARGLSIPPDVAAAPSPDPLYGSLLCFVFEKLCEERLDGPLFIIDHPVEISPLSKQKPEDPRFTERFELYLGGMEIANAFSELNDPDVQAERFRQQLAARAAGDAEAHRFDHDYVRALEHGMPPAAGEGIGIDRLTMLFADRASIRDVILFPLLRPEEHAPDDSP
ncbi:MAG TPA: lysine--tRNA ligase [Thermoanaerobaculia bacterium]